MTTHAHKTDRDHNAPDPNGSLQHLFEMNDGFWWPYRSFAKALMGTQKNASAYLEANRKLMDAIHDIVRKEQDISLEIYNKTIEGIAENDRPRMPVDASAVNAMFERAIESVRELGEAWMNAQMRSLDAMRHHASNGRKSSGPRRAPPETSAAAERARHH